MRSLRNATLATALALPLLLHAVCNAHAAGGDVWRGDAADLARAAVRRHLHAAALGNADRKLAVIDSSLLQIDDAQWTGRNALGGGGGGVASAAAAARARQWRDLLAAAYDGDAGDAGPLNMTQRGCAYVSLNCTNGGLMVSRMTARRAARTSGALCCCLRDERLISRLLLSLVRLRVDCSLLLCCAFCLESLIFAIL